MGLFSWLFQWFGGSRGSSTEGRSASPGSAPSDASKPLTRPNPFMPGEMIVVKPRRGHRHRARPGTVPHLRSSRSDESSQRRKKRRTRFVEVTGGSPYLYARFGSQTGRYLDFSRDGDEARLLERGLPVFHTPEQLAEWLGLPLNKVAWLVHRFSHGKPESTAQAHYHFTWRKKRSGGVRLIESPKQTLKGVQVRILREILDRVPAHPAAHGFVPGRSILTNAVPHVGQGVVVKFDLSNFYTTVGHSRVVAIFRTLGYSREAAIWLGLLTTSAVPGNMPFDRSKLYTLLPYWRRHLPQGAPTSPALANLSAYRLDLRLTGMARSFGANFTRYADDLTISGPIGLSKGLRTLIPLVQQIIRRERFQSNRKKRQVRRAHQRQSIAGVVVNARPNVSRAEFDRLKAILTNCVRLGPASQNRGRVDDFASHLRGRIAHVSQLNPARGAKLLAIYGKIDWRR
jgi:hypothetical protein